MGIQITVKEVDEKAFQELKAAAARRKIAIGVALTLAIENWLSLLGKLKKKMSDLKPVSWGAGTERLSEEIDEVVYD